MIILGIHGDYYNPEKEVFESNAAIIKDGKILSAISEERLSRKKLDGKFPWLAIEESLKIAGITFDQVDRVAFASLSNKANAAAYLKSTLSTYADTGVMVKNKKKIKSGSKGLVNSLLKSDKKDFSLKDGSGKSLPIQYIDHHYSHAAGAFYTSPFKDALVITLDGGGNGLDGGAYMAQGTTIKRFIDIPHFQSPGTMYSAVTHDLGYRRHRHEGKITGLAAYGNPDPEKLGLTDLIRYDKKKHRFISKAIANHHMDLNTNSDYFHPLVEKHSKEDLSAVAQFLFEKVILEFIADAVEQAKKKGFTSKNICLAGGCFANVKLNQGILEMEPFENIYVYPAMGDGGLGSGAALLDYYQSNKGIKDKSASEVDNVYLSKEFSEAEMEAAIKEEGLAYQRYDKVEEEVGKLLAEGKVIARFNGAMEYGPRALGNRSIIGAPFDKTINDWLNKKLNRTEFMPFAPSMIEEKADAYLEGFKKEHIAADFMTITYTMKEGMKDVIPAVVHVDNTARPQIVKKSTNPSYHAIIEAFGKHSGNPVVLNTSFNIHEEPIVYSPKDAIRGFLGAELDYLAMGPFIIPLP